MIPICKLLPTVLFSLLLAAACTPAPTPGLTPIETATPTEAVTWFPATHTPTPFPTQSLAPTYDPRPGLGEGILADDFSQPEAWTTTETLSTRAIVNRNRLTLAVTADRAMLLFSQRAEPLLQDFYAEINASLSLCRGRDQYGLLFRMMSYNDYYRFAVNCAGEVRLERIQGGNAVPLQNWVPSGDAPPGAPSEVRIGVWVSGQELRLFLNDHLQFSLYDPVFRSGALGVFISSTGTTPVTASFSDLRVYQVAYVSPTPTATPSRTPTPTRTPIP
ncbi:MAG: hypothetical protein JXB85_14695 [Anaerolineales bacterium]|nr:hypothetical protein [Anaerolineales bacterium]